MPLRAVFFDLDDTLCDTVSSRQQRARKALEAFGRHHHEYDLEELLDKVMQSHPTIERDIRGLRSVFAKLGLEESEGARAAYACDGRYFDPLHLIEGVAETLEHLSYRHPLGIITNGIEAVQQGKLRHFGLERYVRWLVISEGIGLRKPDRRIFQHALSLAGVEPHQAVFVGDRLDIDVGGAKAAGMRAVWFNHWGGTLNRGSTQPDAVIERFEQLPEVLAGL
jgi:putative hydrolase of the HAD superfamily